MSLDQTVFKKKPILVVRGKNHFFIDRSRRVEFEAHGARWKGDAEGKVHLCSGSYFVVADDGCCRACKVARSSGACRAQKVRVLDITGCRLPGLLARKNAERPDAMASRLELRKFISQLAPDLPPLSDAEVEIAQELLRVSSEEVEFQNPDGPIRMIRTISTELERRARPGETRTTVEMKSSLETREWAQLASDGSGFNTREEAVRAANAARKPTTTEEQRTLSQARAIETLREWFAKVRDSKQ